MSFLARFSARFDCGSQNYGGIVEHAATTSASQTSYIMYFPGHKMFTLEKNCSVAFTNSKM